MRLPSRPAPSLSRACVEAFRRDPCWAEFWSAATAIGWAARSWIEVASLSDWPSMKVVVAIGDDGFWHAAALVAGVAQIAGLVLRHRLLRWCAAAAMCWFWAVLTLGVWAAVPGAPAVAVYCGWCAVNVFSILRHCRRPGGQGHDGGAGE